MVTGNVYPPHSLNRFMLSAFFLHPHKKPAHLLALSAFSKGASHPGLDTSMPEDAMQITKHLQDLLHLRLVV